jgi:stage II sporulation protein AA (anti-sigma F factor antagonist)
MNELEILLRHAPPLIAIDLRGEIGALAEEPLRLAYQQAADIGDEPILLNFKDVEYLSSAGIAAVIALISRALQTERRLFLTGLTPHYQLIFDMMGLTTYAPFFETEEAVRAAILA